MNEIILAICIVIGLAVLSIESKLSSLRKDVISINKTLNLK